MSRTKRFRDYGFSPGLLKTGARNLISDIPGVRVGHATVVKGTDTRTGVTVVDPGPRNLFREKIPAAVAVGNGSGKVAGFSQVKELGTLEAPIALTNTLAVGTVLRGMVDVMVDRIADRQPMDSMNVIVGECNDGFLNDLHADSVSKADVRAACASATEAFEFGCVGAGTGTRAFSWKGGIGSASRTVDMDGARYTVGVLVQTNFGGALTIMGVPVGIKLGMTDFTQYIPTGQGSCMIVLATDAPFDARQLGRLAKHSLYGMLRTGAIMAHASGDYAVAFSTNRSGLPEEPGVCLADEKLNPFFLAAIEAVEESIYDALFLAETTVGRAGNVRERLPIDRVVDMLRKHL